MVKEKWLEFLAPSLLFWRVLIKLRNIILIKRSWSSWWKFVLFRNEYW